MTLKEHLSYFNSTPQSAPIPGREREMIRNDAGGYVFRVDDMTKLERFLVLGTDGGTYYVDEKTHTVRNYSWILSFLRREPKTVLEVTARFSEQGRILKNDTAIAVLAIAWYEGYRKEVGNAFYRIVRIPTHLFMFMSFLKELYGGKVRWNRSLRSMIADWYYENKSLVYHVLKYQSREGWSHADLIRMAHVKPADGFMDTLFGFIVGNGKRPEHPLVEAFVRLREAKRLDEVLNVLRSFDVAWEFIPTHWLHEKAVWELLLPNLPYTALVRNLPRLSSLGIDPHGVAEKLRNERVIRKSLIHPVRLGIARMGYEVGHNRNLSWHPERKILEALDFAIMKAFGNVADTGKKILVAVDGSGSMTWGREIVGSLRPIDAATLVGWYIAVTQSGSDMIGFDIRTWHVPVTSQSTWSEINRQFGLGGGTDASLPFEWARERGRKYDMVVVITDNETWRGDEHPMQALKKYRDAMGINTKLMVMATSATNYSIADPSDPYQLDVVGFDAGIPKLIEEFAKM